MIMQENNYYVAIGASAGGLEAIENFFKSTSDDTGLIYIVIQHLSPDYRSLMNEILARHTNMPIYIIENGMKPQPNSIYLIPPRKNLFIRKAILYLEDQVPSLPINLPIDNFYKSLAKFAKDKAIAVILSGSGKDGSSGIYEIKENGGMIIVQDEESARFSSMPTSAVRTGLVDFILTPELMPNEINHYIQFTSNELEQLNTDSTLPEVEKKLTDICKVLHQQCGINFGHYKESTIRRRIERRLKVNRIDSIDKYYHFLSQSKKEVNLLSRELLIGVTSFFRDTEAFNSLEENVLPKLDFTKETLRIWSCGCSSGEEVYSLAILVSEEIQRRGLTIEYKIFATDIDEKALEYAGIGIYPENMTLDISPELLSKYFNKVEQGYQIKDFIRKKIVFAHHNILKDPPFSRLDLLICRNLFIYIKTDKQQDILHNFYLSLRPGGYLFLGSSETLGDMADAFTVIDSKWKIFRYKEGYRQFLRQPLTNYASRQHTHDYAVRNGNYGMSPHSSVDKLTEGILSATLPSSIVIDSHDNIIQIINDLSGYLSLQPGHFTSNFNNNMTKELSLFINNILRRLKLTKDVVVFRNVSINGVDNLTIKGTPITLGDHSLFLISFIVEKEVKHGNSHIMVDMSEEAKERVLELESELQLAREGLQATIEELETSNEELQSSNEELIASNEELQSTNEELQSVNEELYTVNNEHESKIDELLNMTNDLNNLLKNTEVGAIYLDSQLNIRKITPIIHQITNIRDEDINRPIHHLSVIETYPEIVSDATSVMDHLINIERNITDSENNHWLVRIRPYRTEYNAVNGIIITFIDINALKSKESDYAIINQHLEYAMQLGHMAWWDYNVKADEIMFSPELSRYLDFDHKIFPSSLQKIYNLMHNDDYKKVFPKIERILRGEPLDWDFIFRMKHKGGNYITFKDSGQVLDRDDNNVPKRISGILTDITALKNELATH